jgi:predicted Zn-ribbon and HTH transcriptional regulator
MNRPPLEVADLVRAAGRAFIERSRRWITWQHLKVLRAIARCRTAALGGHLDECTDCGYRPAISYNSCRDRHCPKCQANARHRWLEARRQELLPTRYVHVVFTLPHELAPLALQNKKILYHLLLQTSAETLLEVARDPKHLGVEIGFFSVLHTWNQKLEHHPHAHCVVPAGGLSLDHSLWVPSHSRFFLPIPVLRRVFRRKFVIALKRNFRQGKLGFHGTLTEWCALLSPKQGSPLPISAQSLAPTARKLPPILPALWFAPRLLPDAFLITPTPLNLHKCLPHGRLPSNSCIGRAPHNAPYLPALCNRAHPIQH